MSLKDVLKLSKESRTGEPTPLLGPSLVSLLVEVIQDLIDVCIKEGVALDARIQGFAS